MFNYDIRFNDLSRRPKLNCNWPLYFQNLDNKTPARQYIIAHEAFDSQYKVESHSLLIHILNLLYSNQAIVPNGIGRST